MEEINALFNGFAVAMTPFNLLLMLVGVTLGVIIGVLPGLGGANGIAILLPLTFTMPPTSAIIMLSSTVTLYQAAIVNKHKKKESFVDSEPLKQVMAVLLPAIVFVLGVQLIGIYVSSVFYIAIFMVWLGKYPLWKAIAVAIGVSVALYLMFEFWFQVPLPHGSWFNPLEFVGVN